MYSLASHPASLNPRARASTVASRSWRPILLFPRTIPSPPRCLPAPPLPRRTNIATLVADRILQRLRRSVQQFVIWYAHPNPPADGRPSRCDGFVVANARMRGSNPPMVRLFHCPDARPGIRRKACAALATTRPDALRVPHFAAPRRGSAFPLSRGGHPDRPSTRRLPAIFISRHRNT